MSTATAIDNPFPGGSRWLRTHPRMVSTGLILIFLFFTLIGAVFLVEAEPGSIHGWGILAGIILACCGIWFRFKYTIPAFLISLVGEGLILLGSTTFLGGNSVMYLWPYVLAVRFGFLRAVTATVPALIGYFLLVDLLQPEQLESVTFDGSDSLFLAAMISAVVVFLLIIVISAGIGSTVRRNRVWEEQVRQWAEETKQYAQVEERNRIAREMHDVVAHSLSVMISLSEGARSAIDRNPEQAKEVLGHASDSGRAALADMRRMIGVLRSSEVKEFAPAPSEDSLPELFDSFRKAGLPVTYTSSGPALPESKALQLVVYRMIQEGLTNALRYAYGASRVDVELANHTTHVQLRIVDNGFPSTTEKIGSGQGLNGVRERASLYGGTVKAGPLPERGWEVLVDLPLDVSLDSNLETEATKQPQAEETA